MKKLTLILAVLVLLVSSCSKKDDSSVQDNQKPKTETQLQDKQKTQPVNDVDNAEKKYWVNSKSNVLHNKSCRWYGNTKYGYYTNDCEGHKDCGTCGGCE